MNWVRTSLTPSSFSLPKAQFAIIYLLSKTFISTFFYICLPTYGTVEGVPTFISLKKKPAVGAARLGVWQAGRPLTAVSVDGMTIFVRGGYTQSTVYLHTVIPSLYLICSLGHEGHTVITPHETEIIILPTPQHLIFWSCWIFLNIFTYSR